MAGIVEQFWNYRDGQVRVERRFSAASRVSKIREPDFSPAARLWRRLKADCVRKSQSGRGPEGPLYPITARTEPLSEMQRSAAYHHTL